MRTTEAPTSTVTQEIIPGLLGTFAVALAAIERTSQTIEGITNAPALFFSSFLRGLSQTTPSENDSLDPTSVTTAETMVTQDSPILKQMLKDFNEAYTMQKKKFDVAAASLQTNPDRAKDFLIIPKKEMLALDRSTRSFFLKREYSGSREILDFVDSVGHICSAGSSVFLLNLNKLGETLGTLTGKKLNKTNTIKIPIQIYFLIHFLNKEVLKSSIGKALGLGDLSSSIGKALLGLGDLSSSIGKALGLGDLSSSIGKYSSPALNFIKSINPIKIRLDTMVEKIKEAGRWLTGPTKNTGIANSIGQIGGFVGGIMKFSLNSILAAKTYVLAPALAGIFDGLTESESISQGAIQEVGRAAAEVTPKDQRTFLELVWEDFHIAYNSAVKKFQKYDKFFEKERTAETPMVSVLKKKSAKPAEVLSGREIMLTGETSKKMLGYSDKARAAAQAGASLTASRAYRTGRWTGQVFSDALRTKKKEKTK